MPGAETGRREPADGVGGRGAADDGGKGGACGRPTGTGRRERKAVRADAARDSRPICVLLHAFRWRSRSTSMIIGILLFIGEQFIGEPKLPTIIRDDL